MNQKEIQDAIKSSNELEIKRNSMYGETFRDIISKAAKSSSS